MCATHPGRFVAGVKRANGFAMKILYHHRTRATDAQKVHILEMIEAFRSIGHEVTVASLVETQNKPQDPEREARDATWKVLVRKIPFAYELVQLGYNLIGIPWLLYRIRRTGVDLVYERYALLNFSAVCAAWLAGKPVVLEVNSPLALEQTREKETRAGRFASWTERLICNAATKVVVVSGPLRRIMIQSGVEPSKLFLLPNGVNLKRFDVAQDVGALRNSLGIGSRIVIGFVGWFRPWHGLEFLLDAFRKSSLSGNAVLLLIGDGPVMPQLKAYVEKTGLQHSVVFAGPVSHEEIPRYVKLIDIAVQPAANEYCCPMKILEYMGLAKAIVAPRQENIEELLENGRNALLFQPGNAESLSRALVSLTTQPELRAQIGSRALRTIHERGFLWESNARKVSELLCSNPTVMAYD